MNTGVMFSSKTDQWATPQWFFDELDREFNFTLDPCADDFNHKCEKYFTKEIDGLSQSWNSQRVFCNPPYGKEISDWVKKCYEEVQSGCPLVVLLVPARTDTKWFHNYIYKKAAEIRFIKGRLKFGDAQNSAPFPSMVIVFREQEEEMKVEEIAIRQEIRQMLSESGINKNTLKEMVKGVLHEDVEKACKQAFAEKDMDGIVARKIEYGFEGIVKEVIRESVRDRINAIFHRMTIDIDVTDRNGNSFTETRKTGDL